MNMRKNELKIDLSKGPSNYLYSVVIPVFNSAKIIHETVSRVRDFFISNNLLFEIILVNDASEDLSWDVIYELAKKYREVTSVNLLKNYGQHSANLCGFRLSKGDYLITMDDDLQNPPEEIEKLIDKIHNGYDLVIGNFSSKRHSLIRRIGSRLVGGLNHRVFNVSKNLILSNFRIIRKDVVDRVCLDKSASPYIPGLLLKFSSHPCNVEVRHEERLMGESNYTFAKLFSLVGNILFNHSSIPLRCGAIIGFIISFLSFTLSFYFFFEALVNETIVPGWASLAILLSFFNGVLILFLSIIGEYLIRSLREITAQGSYIVSEIVR